MEAYKNPHKRRNRFARFCYIAATICLMGQAILILASWLWTAAMPESNVRSLLSSAGIRWFFGSFADNEASVLLVWLILLSITWGTILYSGTASAIRLVLLRQSHLLGSQKLLALELAAAMLVVELIIVSLLVFVPHAVLLSVLWYDG